MSFSRSDGGRIMRDFDRFSGMMYVGSDFHSPHQCDRATRNCVGYLLHDSDPPSLLNVNLQLRQLSIALPYV
jgi:hypothetical protein